MKRRSKNQKLADAISKAIAENNDVDTVVLSDEALLDRNMAIMETIPSHVAIVTKISAESNVEKIKSFSSSNNIDNNNRKIIFICSKRMSKTLSISDSANATIFTDSLDVLLTETLQQIASFGTNVLLIAEGDGDNGEEAQSTCYVDDT